MQAGLQGASRATPRHRGSHPRQACITTIEKLSFVGNLRTARGYWKRCTFRSCSRPKAAQAGNQVKNVGDYLSILDQTKNRIGTEVSASLEDSHHDLKVGKVPLGATEADTTLKYRML